MYLDHSMDVFYPLVNQHGYGDLRIEFDVLPVAHHRLTYGKLPEGVSGGIGLGELVGLSL